MHIQEPIIHKHSFLGHLPSYFAQQSTPRVRELYVNSAILDFAVSMILFFEPIHLYRQGFSLFSIALFYFGVYFLYFFLLPLGGKFIKRYGIVQSIFLGSPFLILYYLCFALLSISIYFIYPAIIFFALQKMFYWPGFHADMVEHGVEVEQGREVGSITAIILFVYIAGPLVGGTLLYFFGFTALFITVAVFIMLSNFPLLLTPERVNRDHFSYRGALSRIVGRTNRRAFISYLGFGEELILLAFWPIFIFIIVQNTFSAGVIVSLSTLATAATVLYVGTMTDKKSKEGILRLTSIIYACVWFIRIFVQSAFGVFLVDSLSRIGKNALSVPQMAITYVNARKKDFLETVIFFEMSLVVGKLIALLAVMAIIVFFPPFSLWHMLFLLAGIFSLLYSVLHERSGTNV